MYNFIDDSHKPQRVDTLTEGTDMAAAPVLRGYALSATKGSQSHSSQETKQKDVGVIDGKETAHAEAGKCTVLHCGAHAL